MKILSILLIAGLLLSACSDDTGRPPSKTASEEQSMQRQTLTPRPTVRREFDTAKITRGTKLFAQNCAVCHGSQAEGTPQWTKPGPDGKYLPPPLNGTAHTWHHPTVVLKRTIKEGTGKLGGNMPPWGDKLSDEEIEAIIAWFQSLWPDEIYAVWLRLDAESRAQSLQ